MNLVDERQGALVDQQLPDHPATNFRDLRPNGPAHRSEAAPMMLTATRVQATLDSGKPGCAAQVLDVNEAYTSKTRSGTEP